MPSSRLLLALAAAATAIALTACSGSEEPQSIAHMQLENPPLPPLRLTATAPAQSGAARRDRAASRRDRGAPGVAAGAPSDAEIAAELKQAFRQTDGASADPNRSIVDTATLSSGGIATIPPSAPREVAVIINAANQVATRPYVYGGGHGRLAGETFVDSAYDCSGSISFAFASAGLIDRPIVSGELARYGKPGPGKWVTIYANDGHAWMTVGGLRFDTSGLREHGSRWQTQLRSTTGFTVRHPPGL